MSSPALSSRTVQLPAPPALGACLDPSSPPQLPTQFEAVALLTPFSMDEPLVASVAYDWSWQAMVVDVLGLTSGEARFLVVRDETYVSIGGEWFGPFELGWSVPAPDWLAGRGCSCQGTQRVLTQPCAWWVGMSPCTNGCEQQPCAPADVGNWLWFRVDNDLPWRMMFIDASNPYGLPVLGAFAFVHFPTFVAQAPRLDIGQVAAQARERAAAGGVAAAEARAVYPLLRRSGAAAGGGDHGAKVQRLIPGLQPLQGTCSGLPRWTNTMYMTALTVQTAARDVLATAVFYDAGIERMLTRLWEPQGVREDLILTPGQTYDVVYEGGTLKSCSKADPVGPPYPDWAYRDQCQCRAQIVDNPDFAPGETLVLFACPSDPPRNFWIWYTTAGRPVMFSEVPQRCDVGLVLVDYYDWIPNAAIDPSTFDLPPDCGQPSLAAARPARPGIRRWLHVQRS